jgi:hypothetical protein
MKYDFNDPEHFKKLEKQAYDGSIDVTGFPPAAYRYFDSLRLLYARYKYDNLGKKEAQSVKQKLLAEYKEASGNYDMFCFVHKEYQTNIRKAGTLLSDIEKAQDIREIALKSCECIGLMTGDADFLKRQMNKFKGEKL